MLISKVHIINNTVVMLMEGIPKQLRCVFSVIAVKASIACDESFILLMLWPIQRFVGYHPSLGLSKTSKRLDKYSVDWR
jgi:hypothetical protein